MSCNAIRRKGKAGMNVLKSCCGRLPINGREPMSQRMPSKAAVSRWNIEGTDPQGLCFCWGLSWAKRTRLLDAATVLSTRVAPNTPLRTTGGRADCSALVSHCSGPGLLIESSVGNTSTPQLRCCHRNNRHVQNIAGSVNLQGAWRRNSGEVH